MSIEYRHGNRDFSFEHYIQKMNETFGIELLTGEKFRVLIIKEDTHNCFHLWFGESGYGCWKDSLLSPSSIERVVLNTCGVENIDNDVKDAIQQHSDCYLDVDIALLIGVYLDSQARLHPRK